MFARTIEEDEILGSEGFGYLLFRRVSVDLDLALLCLSIFT